MGTWIKNQFNKTWVNLDLIAEIRKFELGGEYDERFGFTIVLDESGRGVGGGNAKRFAITFVFDGNEQGVTTWYFDNEEERDKTYERIESVLGPIPCV